MWEVGGVGWECGEWFTCLVQRRHDRMGLRVYWGLCWKYSVKSADVWYKDL